MTLNTNIKEFGDSFIHLLDEITKISNDMLRESFFDISKNIIGPLSNFIEVAKFHKCITNEEYESLKKKLGEELNKFEELKKQIKDDWEW